MTDPPAPEPVPWPAEIVRFFPVVFVPLTAATEAVAFCPLPKAMSPPDTVTSPVVVKSLHVKSAVVKLKSPDDSPVADVVATVTLSVDSSHPIKTLSDEPRSIINPESPDGVPVVP